MATSEDEKEPPPDYDLGTHEPLSRTSSQSAASISTLTATHSFHPARSFFIHAHGIGWLRIPGPSTETSIPVTDEATGKTVYTSIRKSKWASEWELKNEASKVLGRVNGDRFSNIVLREIQMELIGKGGGIEAVKMKRKALMTRTCVFEYGGWIWIWRYGRQEEGAGMNGHTLLVCERRGRGVAGGEGLGQSVKVAQLVRDKEMDEKGGVKSTAAGRGGRLDISEGVTEGGEVMEVLVVISCLVMLKKEMDRRRNTTGAALSPPGSALS